VEYSKWRQLKSIDRSQIVPTAYVTTINFKVITPILIPTSDIALIAAKRHLPLMVISVFSGD